MLPERDAPEFFQELKGLYDLVYATARREPVGAMIGRLDKIKERAEKAARNEHAANVRAIYEEYATHPAELLPDTVVVYIHESRVGSGDYGNSVSTEPGLVSWKDSSQERKVEIGITTDGDPIVLAYEFRWQDDSRQSSASGTEIYIPPRRQANGQYESRGCEVVVGIPITEEESRAWQFLRGLYFKHRAGTEPLPQAVSDRSLPSFLQGNPQFGEKQSADPITQEDLALVREICDTAKRHHLYAVPNAVFALLLRWALKGDGPVSASVGLECERPESVPEEGLGYYDLVYVSIPTGETFVVDKSRWNDKTGHGDVHEVHWALCIPAPLVEDMMLDWIRDKVGDGIDERGDHNRHSEEPPPRLTEDLLWKAVRSVLPKADLDEAAGLYLGGGPLKT